MKKFNLFKMLAVLIVLITSINTAWAGTKRVYVNTSAINSWWTTTFTYAWNGSGNKKYDMTAVTGKTNWYYADIDDAYTSIIFYRASEKDGGWWNQTTDITMGSNNYWALRDAKDYDKQLWDAGKYAPAVCISGDFNDWSPIANPFVNNSVSITLSANTTYSFKVADELSWYGRNSSFIGQTSYHTMSTGENNCHLLTAEGGTYTFTWDNTNKRLTVTYPTVTHPTRHYVYFQKPAGWDHVYVHMYNASEEADNYPGPESETMNWDGHTYYYAAIGDMTTAVFGDNNDSKKTGDIGDIATHKGKYLDHTTDPYWFDFQATLTLSTDQGETRNPSPNTVTVTYGANTNINVDVLTTSPLHNGYTFGGYYTAPGGSGTQIINTSEKIPSDLDGYTSSSNWIKKGSSVSADLYAKWTQNVVLDKENGDSNGSVTLTYNSSSHAAITNPTRNGYTFAGWYTEDDGSGTLVINTSGVLQANVTGYTGAGGIWTYDGSAPTLHAKWTPNPLTYRATSGKNWNTAANWTNTDGGTAGCVPTSGHDVTITADVTVNINNAVAKSVTIDGGVLTIPATGALEVAGAITNTSSDEIIIKSNNTNQGALIFNSDGTTAKATVELTMQYADPEVGKFQMVAIPIPYVDVSAAFAGTGAYTFAWKHGTGWDQRGYYDGFSSFEAVLVKGKAGTSFSGALVSTSDFSSGSLSYDGSVDNGDVHMFGNSWTAPIRRTNVSCTNATISILDGSTQKWDGVVAGGLIPALQGYAVVVGSTGGSFSINYTNAVRTATTPNEPLHAPKRYADEDPEPITLYVSGNELRTRIRLFEDETRFSDDLDEGWEAYYMEGGGLAGEMYAAGPEKKMDVLATSNLEGTVVGFVPGEATDYTISFAGDGKGYYLNDMKTGASTLIDEANAYDFTSDESTNAKRFVISKTPMMPTGVDEVADGSNARKQLIDGTLYIIRDGRIYNAEGAVVK